MTRSASFVILASLAEVAEQADAHDSKSCSLGSVGSIPTFGTRRWHYNMSPSPPEQGSLIPSVDPLISRMYLGTAIFISLIRYCSDFHHHRPRLIVVHRSARFTPKVIPSSKNSAKYHHERLGYHICRINTIENTTIIISLVRSRTTPFVTSQRSNKTPGIVKMRPIASVLRIRDVGVAIWLLEICQHSKFSRDGARNFNTCRRVISCLAPTGPIDPDLQITIIEILHPTGK